MSDVTEVLADHGKRDAVMNDPNAPTNVKEALANLAAVDTYLGGVQFVQNEDAWTVEPATPEAAQEAPSDPAPPSGEGSNAPPPSEP